MPLLTWRRHTTGCPERNCGNFNVDVGLHQGSALSPFLFAIIIDKLTEDIRKNAPWDMLFADDIVLSRQNCRELEDDLEM